MIKRLAWFVFKSPQRKLIGFSTLLTDAGGLMNLAFGRKPEGRLWICVGLKDRTEPFKRLVQSLNETDPDGRIGLSVCDTGSADAEVLQTWLRANRRGEVRWEQRQEDFQRSRAFNAAIAAIPDDLFFACDADMTLPAGLEAKVRSMVRPRTAWFPICRWQLEEQGQAWKWFTAGTGLFAAHKRWHAAALPYNEKITGWGGEDWDLFFRFYQKGIMPLRSREYGLYHHWHPSLKPADWQPLF